MLPECPKCDLKVGAGPKVTLHGSFYRTSDSQVVKRFHCRACGLHFSRATLQPAYRQRKRHKNALVRSLLCSGVSQRRTARILVINRKTVVRKFLFLSAEAKFLLTRANLLHEKAKTIQFDDLETFEHTKCKPLSVTLAVEEKTRRILGLRVSAMPAKSPLARFAEKYGPRRDERRPARRALFEELQGLTEPGCLIKSDQSPHYVKDVAEYFPRSVHKRYKGRQGSSTGYGELKKGKFDPIFSLNHTFAMFRDNLNRLRRRTWATSKRADRLEAHLFLYAHYHNSVLI